MITILIDVLLEQKVPNIIITPIGKTNNIQKIFDDLKREIETTKQPDAIKLINEGNMKGSQVGPKFLERDQEASRVSLEEKKL